MLQLADPMASSMRSRVAIVRTRARAQMQVSYSDYEDTFYLTGVTGDAVDVTCDAGYSGGGLTECGVDGAFTSVTCSPEACTATQVPH